MKSLGLGIGLGVVVLSEEVDEEEDEGEGGEGGDEGEVGVEDVGVGGVSSSVVVWSVTEVEGSEEVRVSSAVEVVEVGLVGWSLSVSEVLPKWRGQT